MDLNGLTLKSGASINELIKMNYTAASLHGDITQGQREKILQQFRNKQVKILVATDIAARGIDIEQLSLVINFDLPNIPETYVHRIGRTGRANASGIALSFCNTEEKAYLKDIQKLIGQSIPLISEHPYVDYEPDDPTAKPSNLRRPQHQSRRPRPNSNSGNSNQNKYKRFHSQKRTN